jgi:cytochrome c peroxidase
MHNLKSWWTWLPLAFLLFAALSPRALPAAQDADGYVWNLPPGFPRPLVPKDNPMSASKVELGRRLFYDRRMSVNGKASCAGCHKQELAFTDGRAVAVGATGESHARSAMSLVNVAYAAALTWGNPQMTRLEEQALVPMFGALRATPRYNRPASWPAIVELGLREGDGFLPMLRSDATYRALFERAFAGSADLFTLANVTRALASFERSIVSARSPYDRYRYGGDSQAISDSAKRGETLFLSQRLACSRCHGGFNFSDATGFEGDAPRQAAFHNTGLYNLPGAMSYPPPNVGIYEYSRAPADIGKFKAPTLRNIAVTAPYMHDGSIPTLAEVLDHYAAGGRTIASGPRAGNGRDNPNKDPLVTGFTLSRQDRDDLIAFLESLTDEAVLHDPRFADPWVQGK